MKLTLVTALLLLMMIVHPVITQGNTIFRDDFNRPDGAVGPPWEPMGSTGLLILNQRAVSEPGEYGRLTYALNLGAVEWEDIAFSARFSYNGSADWHNNRFQFFIYGSDAEQTTYWGFIAKIEGPTVELFTVSPEVQIGGGALDIDADGVYALEFGYRADTQRVSLQVKAEDGTQCVNLSALSPCQPFGACAIGIENLESGGLEKWIDDVEFYSSLSVGVENLSPELALSTWPQPFSTRVHLSATDIGGESPTAVVHDVLGRELSRIGLRGGYGVWDGRDAAGRELPSGVYLINIVGDTRGETVKVLKVR